MGRSGCYRGTEGVGEARCRRGFQVIRLIEPGYWPISLGMAKDIGGCVYVKMTRDRLNIVSDQVVTV